MLDLLLNLGLPTMINVQKEIERSPGLLFCLFVTEAFMAWAVIEIALFTMQKYRYRISLHDGWMPVSANRYLLMVIAAAVISYLFCTTMPWLHFMLGLVLGCGIVLSILHPVAAAGFFITNILMRPWELSPFLEATNGLPKFLAGLTILSWIIDRVRHRRFEVRWGAPGSLFTALIAWIAVAILASGTADQDLPELTKAFIPIYTLGMLVYNTADEELDLRLIKRIIVISVTGVIMSAIMVTVLAPRFATGTIRLEGPGLMGNSNDLGSMIAMAVPFLTISIAKWKIRERNILGMAMELLCVVILLYGLKLSQSRGTILSIFAAGGVFILSQSKSIKKTLIQLTVLSVIPLIAMQAIKRDEGDLEGSSESRMNYIVTGFRMFVHSPIFGVGMNNYPRRYEQFTSNFDEWGERTAHSTWMLFLAETGIVGFALYVGIYGLAVRRSWLIRKDNPEYLMILTSYGIASSFLSHSYNFFPYLTLYLVLAAGQVKAPQVETQAAATGATEGINPLKPAVAVST